MTASMKKLQKKLKGNRSLHGGRELVSGDKSSTKRLSIVSHDLSKPWNDVFNRISMVNQKFLHLDVSFSVKELTGVISEPTSNEASSSSTPLIAFIAFNPREGTESSPNNTSFETYLPSIPITKYQSERRKQFSAKWQEEACESLSKSTNSISFSRSLKGTGQVKCSEDDPDAVFNPDVLEIRVGLIQGGEMITLGYSSLVISGELETTLVQLPVHKYNNTGNKSIMRKKEKWKAFEYNPHCRYKIQKNKSFILMFLTVKVSSGDKISERCHGGYCDKSQIEEWIARNIDSSRSFESDGSSIFGDLSSDENDEDDKASINETYELNSYPVSEAVGDEIEFSRTFKIDPTISAEEWYTVVEDSTTGDNVKDRLKCKASICSPNSDKYETSSSGDESEAGGIYYACSGATFLNRFKM